MYIHLIFPEIQDIIQYIPVEIGTNEKESCN